ncbi:hypothetical protein J6590_062671 [Homalodisca vitripennis]|nr:hypothetical protein J6590_062671 [Homalodisca vitripennis]
MVHSTGDVPERSVGVRWVSQALAEAMMDFAPNSDNNPECNLHSSLYLQGLANSTLWAVQSLRALRHNVEYGKMNKTTTKCCVKARLV